MRAGPESSRAGAGSRSRSGQRGAAARPGGASIPFVLVEANEGLYRELLHRGVLVAHGSATQHDIRPAAGIERARGVCIVIDNDADDLDITFTAKALNPGARVITRAGQQQYAQAMRSSGANEVVIPEYQGGLIVGRMMEKHYPAQAKLE